MDRRTSRLGGIIVTLATLWQLPAAHAEESGITEQSAITMATTEARRQVVMAANVQMSDAEGAEFWPLYKDYRGEVAKINQKVLALIRDFAENYNSLTEAQAQSVPLVEP